MTKLGSSAPECFQRYRDTHTLCPLQWLEKAKEEADAGKYMGVAPVFEYDDE